MSNAPGISVVPPESGPRPNLARSEGRKDISYHVTEPSLEDWKNQKEEVIIKYFRQTYDDFFGIVNDYIDQANTATALYKSCLRSHRTWRVATFVGTGALTLINGWIAVDPLNNFGIGAIRLPVLLSSIAAVLAAWLTVSGNVEAFLNKRDEATVFLEIRELLVSQHREYSSKWVCYVDAYGRTPMAFINAGRLYGKLVDSDQQLRQKIKQLTKVKGNEKTKISTAGSLPGK
jgi:hypothetical protein